MGRSLPTASWIRRNDLLQDTTVRERFLTIDRWQNESLFAQMHHTSRQEYSRLDAMFGELTVSERRVGLFLSL